MRSRNAWFFAVALSALPVFGTAATPPISAPSAPIEPMPPHTHFAIDSKALGESRPLNVYLPPGYENSGDRYPLLVMPDGGEAEDFPHVATTIDAAIRAGAMQPLVLIGIKNTERRRDMTGPTTLESDTKIAAHVGGSAAFRRFIGDELLPQMRLRYRLNAHAGIVGESLAGLFVIETMLLEPQLFDRYIAFSPSLWWNGGALVHDASAALKNAANPPIWLFLAVGDDDDRDDRIAAFADVLKAAVPKTMDWRFEPHHELRHDTIYRGLEAKALRAAFPPESR